MRQAWLREHLLVLFLALGLELTEGAELMPNMTKILMEQKVIPDYIPELPPQFCQVKYVHTVVEFGIQLDTLTVMHQPTNVKWVAEKGSYYTLLLTGLDVPTRENNSHSEFNHWIVGNIPENAVFAGETVAEYVGTGLPYGKGIHRLLFLVYEQADKKKVVFDEETIRKESRPELRRYFSAQKFAAKYNMGNPIAISLARVEEML